MLGASRWEQRVRLGTREGGEREVPWKSKECGEEALGVELEEYEEPLLEL